jgi:RecJ-like exonuclease
MEKYKQFDTALEKAAFIFKSWDKRQPIKLVSHLDADGIAASAIMTHLLNAENRKFSISILQQLSREDIVDLAKENYRYIIFSDLGSGQLNDIEELLKEKEILILDHHELAKKETTENITQVNPHIFGIDGSKEISGAGVSYLFASLVNEKSKALAHIAVIGAIGDIQGDYEFLHLNKRILEAAVNNGTIKQKKTLKLFGMQTRPIHKAIEYANELEIPGITGSESGAIQFLQELGIKLKDRNAWRTISDLDDEEMKKLATGIILKRFGQLNPEDIFGEVYLLENEESGPTKEAREFATLLNACGRMERASCGIGTCLGIEKDRKMALQTLADYKKELINAINWYEENIKSDSIIKGSNYIILNAKDKVFSNIIGTLASIISKSASFKKDTYILSLARTKKNKTKASLRKSRSSEADPDLNLRAIVKDIVEKTGAGEAGGHMQAAGAIIPTEKEEEFIDAAKDVLGKL